VQWNNISCVHGAALEEVLYHKSEGEGIAKVIFFDLVTRFSLDRQVPWNEPRVVK